MLKEVQGETGWGDLIHDALQDQRFRLCYQPIMPIRSDSEETGGHYEVLIRMVGDDSKLVRPGAFMPAAKRYNLVTKLDHWVVEATFSWLMKHPEHLDNLHMCSINLSQQSVDDQDFLDFTTGLLRDSDIPPGKICFEVSESTAIANLSRATSFIDSLKEVGCAFALDDFGSGLSSFGYLHSMPVDYLKIDGLFVKGIADDPDHHAMVSSINEIGHITGKQTIAEFVEDDAILDKLRDMDIDYAQGYGIGRPRLFSGQG